MSYISPWVLALVLFAPAFSNAEQVETSPAHNLQNSKLPERAAEATTAEFPCDSFAKYVTTAGEYPKKSHLSLNGRRYSVANSAGEQKPVKTGAGLFSLYDPGSGWRSASLHNVDGMADWEFEATLMFGAYLLRSGMSAFVVEPTSGMPGNTDITVVSLNHPKAEVVCLVRKQAKYSAHGLWAQYEREEPWPETSADLEGLWSSFPYLRHLDDLAGPYAASSVKTLNNAGPFYFLVQYFPPRGSLRWLLRVGEETNEVFRVDEPPLGQENECVTLAIYGSSADPRIICTGVHDVIRRYSNRRDVTGAQRTLRLEEVETPAIAYRALSPAELAAWKAEQRRLRYDTP